MKAHQNPFRSSNLEQIRYALDAAALDQMAESALRLCRSSVLGPKGTGKTTLLEDLEPHFQARGLATHWLRLNEDSSPLERTAAVHAVRALPNETLCLFDGLEVLNRWQQFQVQRYARQLNLALIATLHHRNRLPILHQTRTDWPLTKQLVRQLAKDHCSPDLMKLAQIAFQQSGGNVREVFRACYWQLAH